MPLAEQEQPSTDEPVTPIRMATTVDDPAEMRRIAQPGLALVIWRRRLAPALREELARLELDTVDDILLTSAAARLDRRLAGAMAEAGYPDTPLLRRDVAMLARRHAAITGGRHVRIRLEVVETDACRKFHADHVTLRAITSYLGDGTQWIEARSAERAGLPGGPAIERIETGAVAMFKGRLWQEPPTILHRSPPIGDRGVQRLLLVVDPVTARADGGQ